MEFVSQIREVPVTHTTRLRLRRFAKALHIAEEAAAGYAIERYMQEHGEFQIRLAAAAAVVAKDRTRDRDPDAPTCPAAR